MNKCFDEAIAAGMTEAQAWQTVEGWQRAPSRPGLRAETGTKLALLAYAERTTLEDNRKFLAMTMSYLALALVRAEITAAENAVSSKEEHLVALDLELASTRRRIAILDYRFEQNEDIVVEAEKEYQDLSAKISTNEQTAEQYQNSIDYLDEVLNTSEAESIAKAEDRATWEEREATLVAKRADLHQQYARLNGINDGMAVEQTMLAGLLKKVKDRG